MRSLLFIRPLFVPAIILLFLSFLSLILSPPVPWLVSAPNLPLSNPNETQSSPGKVSLGFVENVGQFDEQARFQIRGEQRTVWLAPNTLWITLLETPDFELLTQDVFTDPSTHLSRLATSPRQGFNLKLSFVGANPNPRLEPFNQLPGQTSYFTNAESEQSYTDVPSWAGIRYVNLYPGIDLEIENENGHLLPRLVCQANCSSSLQEVRLHIEGAETLALLASADSAQINELQITTVLGDFILPLLPVVTADGTPLELTVSPSLLGTEVLAPFVSPSFLQMKNNHEVQTGSDLLYLTFLEGSSTEYGWGIAIDDVGSAYLTGMTDSTDFPTTPGAFDTTLNNSFDAFVAKLTPDGSDLEYATFIGGSALDQGSKIAVDEAGNAYIAGYTFSSDFPVTAGAYDTDYNGGDIDAFIAKVNPDGSDLAYATYLGGTSDDYGGGITVDGLGNAYLTGYTESADFPTTPAAYDTSYNGGGDVIVVKINTVGDDLAYSTFVGASAFEAGYSIALDGMNNAYITGHTYSTGFPTTAGAFDMDYNGGLTDAFVIKALSDGSDLSYASFLGGADFDDGKGIAVNTVGDAYIAGRTNSENFPTTPGAFDTEYNGGRDVFAIHINPNGSTLGYGTFLGGGAEEEAGGVALDWAGNSYMTGWTFSSDFPTSPGAYDPTHNGDTDAFMVKLLPAGDDLVYSTFLGIDTTNYGRGIAVDVTGSVYVGGYVGSLLSDVFALKLLPNGEPMPTPTATSTVTPTLTATATPTATTTSTPTATPISTPTAPSHWLYLPAVWK